MLNPTDINMDATGATNPTAVPIPANQAATPGAAPPSAVEAPPAQEENSRLSLVDLGDFVRQSPPWLASAVLHMVLMIALALWLVVTESEKPIAIDASFGDAAEDVSMDVLDELPPLEDFKEEQLDLPMEPLPEVAPPIAMPEIAPLLPNASLAVMRIEPPEIGQALDGRNPNARATYLEAFGGTKATEAAVIAGLKWLERQQLKNGSWSLRGPYSNGSGSENPEAATAMALLAFQGHGHTTESPNDDPFRKVVRRGWNWLLDQQHQDGHFYRNVGSPRLYTHAQCTIAICELYAMTENSEYRYPAQKAIDYCVEIQTKKGGWRYNAGRDEDLSVTGWFAMALQSARMAGLEVPQRTLKRLNSYLDSVEKEYGSRYSYTPSRGATPAMTAEGLLCRQYLGWQRDNVHLQDGVDYLLRFRPTRKEQNVYHWYYATQVLHHMEGEPWEKWNGVMREFLPKQQRKRGKERGSWDPGNDRWGSVGGRLYQTCLSIYILEVYYRHMPLYSSIEAGE